jgi:hypothetical protein
VRPSNGPQRAGAHPAYTSFAELAPPGGAAVRIVEPCGAGAEGCRMSSSPSVKTIKVLVWDLDNTL